MVFSSLLFVFVFLPLFLAAYYATPSRWRNATALVASLVFYAWGEPRFVLVLAVSSAADYALSRAMCRAPAGHAARRRALLAAALALNLGCLAFFKYANFAVAQVGALCSLLGCAALPWREVVLPIGVSFFTFQKISYLVDVYRGTVRPARSFSDYVLYVALFPQLIAGPIVRYHDVADQIRQRTHSADEFARGWGRFCLGLGKKVLVANVLAQAADRVFAMDPARLPAGLAWIGILAYSFQIYFDFSGYSDMALGLGRMIGFRFLENFDRPYVARSFTEFWRRWHISLSNWMKEYLYVPLGGNRVARPRMFLNLWVVFLVSGLWHGAAWTFVAWGAFHGLFLVLDRTRAGAWAARLPGAVRAAGTFLLVMAGWVLFRSDTLGHAAGYLAAMAGAGAAGAPGDPTRAWQEILGNRGAAMLAVAAAASWAPDAWVGAARDRLRAALPAAVRVAVHAVAAGALFLLSASSLANLDFNPFIYFRF